MAATETKVPRITINIIVLASFVALAGCQGGAENFFPKAERPIPERLVKVMKAKGMTNYSPIFIRIFKNESTLEVWKKKDTARYDLLETYDICKWSGKLGPKIKEGDRQAPEGFYTVAQAQMNPLSSYHLSFNMGYPNTYDRSNNRTGTHLMVHGACSSAGCYSMTNELVEEIYALARDSFKGGQRKFQIQAFPFRMTPENMVRHENNEHYEFWKMLKKGHDHFEITKRPPKIDVCERKYVFNRRFEDGVNFKSTATCPQSTISQNLEAAYLTKSRADNLEMAEIRTRIEKERQLKLLKIEQKQKLEKQRAEQKQRLEKLLSANKPQEVPVEENLSIASSSATDTNQSTNETIVNQTNVEQTNVEQMASELVPLTQADQTATTNIVPQPRPILEGEQPPVEKKQRRGLFSWLKRN